MSSHYQDLAYVGDDDSQFFRLLYGKTLNTLNPRYLLPADEDERRVSNNTPSSYFYFIGGLHTLQRCEYHHRLVQFLFGGKNYIGPVKEALQFGQHRRSMSCRPSGLDTR